jgi:hypothetical protein
MRRFFNPSQDASIYEEFYWRNTGHDEVVEVGKSDNGVNRIRSIIQFDLTSISSSIADGTIPISASFDLKLFVARADSLSPNQNIYLYQINRSWDEGTGYFYQNTNVPFTSSRSPSGGFYEDNGTTWRYRSSGSLWSSDGGEYYTGSILSGTIADPVTDMTFDVSSFVRSWVSGTVVNNGFLMTFPSASESESKNVGNIKFFSRQTHTIYVPQLIAKWSDQQYLTGSLSDSSPSNALVTIKNLKPKYKLGEIVRLDLAVRDRYPIRTFDTIFSALSGNQRLPSSSFFSIVDIQSNTQIVPFDNISTVSCDGSGSYFNFRVEGMFPGRFYKVMVKVQNQGYEQIYDSGHSFSVEKI